MTLLSPEDFFGGKVPTVNQTPLTNETKLRSRGEVVQGILESLGKKHNFTTTSITRPPDENRRVRGVRRSQHLEEFGGTARDFSIKGKTQAEIDAMRAELEEGGFEVLVSNHGTGPHMHAELPPDSKLGLEDEQHGIGGSDNPPRPPAPKLISPEDFFGAAPTTAVASVEEEEDGFFSNAGQAIGSAATRTWDSLKRKIDETTRLGGRTAAIAQEERDEGILPERYVRELEAIESEYQEAGLAERKAAEPEQPMNPGEFFSNLPNPVQAVLEDSLPANYAELYAGAPQLEASRLEAARKTWMQERILANPAQFPDVSIQAAMAAKAERLGKVDPTVRQQWDQLIEMAKADPKVMGAQLTAALYTDPYMLLVPIGVGVKPIQIANKARKVTEAAGTVARVTDNVVDAAATGAGLNVGIAAVDQASRGIYNAEELKGAAALGALIGGPLGAIFGRGGPKTPKDKAITDQTLLDILEGKAQDVSENPLTAEQAVAMQQEWRTRLGLKSDADVANWWTQRTREVRKTFETTAERNAYVQFIDAGRKAAAKRAAAAQERSEVAAARAAARSTNPETRTAGPKSSTPESAGDASVGGVAEVVDNAQVIEALKKPGFQRTAADKVAIAKALGKNQKGEIDPKLLARGAVVGAGSLVGYGIMANEGRGKEGAFWGGLAGALIPAGGQVLRRMNQAGAVSPDGSLNWLPKEIRAADELQLVERVKNNDMQAFEELYKQYKNRVVRFVKPYLRDASGKTGIDAEGIADDAFFKAYQNIKNFESRNGSGFYTWVTAIAKNEAINAIQKSSRRVDTVTTDADPLADLSGPTAKNFDNALKDADTAGAAAHYDTPEYMAAVGDAEEILQAAFAKINPHQRQAIIEVKINGLTEAEAAAKLDVPIGTIKTRIHHGMATIQDMLTKGRGKPPKRQLGAAETKLMLATGITAAAATAGMAMFPKEPAKGAVAGVMLAGMAALGRGKMKFSPGRMGGPGAMEQMGAIKGPGGNFTADTVQIMADSFYAFERSKAENVISRYLNRYAGQETDPLKDVQLPGGGTWGVLMDELLEPATVKAWQDRLNLDAAKGPQGEIQYGIRDATFESQALGTLQDYLRHVSDYAQTLTPDQLAKYDFVRLVKETVEWDKANKKKAEKAKAIADTKLKTYIQFPDGDRWVRLDSPGQFAQESDVMGHSVRGYEPTPAYSMKDWYDIVLENDVAAELRERWEARPKTRNDTSFYNWLQNTPEYQSYLEANPLLEGAGEGGHAQYGYGGWDAIKNDVARIYSLRGKGGKSIATVEVGIPDNGYPDSGGFEVSQIKGRYNGPVPDEAKPKVQELLRNLNEEGLLDLDKSDMFGDWKNAGLQPLLMHDGSLKFVDEAQYSQIPDTAGSARSEFFNSTPDALRSAPKVPRSIQGSADPRVLKGIALVGTGVTIGAMVGNELRNAKKESAAERSFKGAVAGGALGTLFALGGGRQLAKGADFVLGPVNTRLANIAKPLVGRAWKQTQQEFVNTHRYLQQVDPFLETLNKHPAKDIITRALMTGDGQVIRALFKEINDPVFTKQFEELQKAIQSIEHQMVEMGIIKKPLESYFPRSVKDLEGLKNALDKKSKDMIKRAIDAAEAKHQRLTGEALPDRMKDLIVNRILQGFDENGDRLPGYAKGRRVQEITPELQPFYHTPEAALHSYIRAAVKDIEKRKFFGRDLVVKDKGVGNFVNTKDSIGAIVRRLMDEGKITSEQRLEIESMLKDRFGGGEKAMSKGLSDAKSYINAALLGNVFSAATQVADTILQAVLQGPIATIKAMLQMAGRSTELDVNKMGLADYIATEFITTGTAEKVARFSFKWGGFRAIDHFGKNFAMNAGIIRLRELSKTPAGLKKLAAKYEEYFSADEYKQVVKDLQSGNRTQLTDTLAIAELSRTQPISMWELPQAYHRVPNGRVLYHLQTFNIKVLDMLRNEAFGKILSGKPKNIAVGVKQLIKIGVALGVGGTASDKIKDVLAGREVSFHPSEIPLNFLETLGMSTYTYDKIASGRTDPLTAMAEAKIPPIIKVSGDVFFNGEIVNKIPVVGRVYDEWTKPEKKEKKK